MTLLLSQIASELSEAISEHPISKNFLAENAPDSPSLAFLCMHGYIHIINTCNASSINPGYRPPLITVPFEFQLNDWLLQEHAQLLSKC